MSAVWYFAYGSNMSSATFRGSRGIEPLAELAVKIPGWTLTFDIFGIPYQEPGFASIAPISAPPPSHPLLAVEDEEVHGIAYLVTPEQYAHIIASEGGDIVYAQLDLPALPLHPCPSNNNPIVVKTLVTSFACTPPRLPSLRYKQLMIHGGREAALPTHYQRHLESLPCYAPPRTLWARVGAALFLALWTPVMMAAERLTKATANFDGRGNVPAVTRRVVRLVLLIMWLHHDWVHGPIWGRGDGLEEEEEVGEKERVLMEWNA